MQRPSARHESGYRPGSLGLARHLPFTAQYRIGGLELQRNDRISLNIIVRASSFRQPLCALGMHASRPSLRSHGLVFTSTAVAPHAILGNSCLISRRQSVTQSSLSRSQTGHFLGRYGFFALPIVDSSTTVTAHLENFT